MSRSATAADRWLIAGVPRAVRAGGSVRARWVFSALAERTGAEIVGTHGRRGLLPLAYALARRSSAWRREASLASARLIPDPGTRLIRAPVRGRVLDFHDHPRRQWEAFGDPLSGAAGRRLDKLVERNLERFELLSVPSRTFAELCGLPADRVIVVTNGTDSRRFPASSFPQRPVVGMVSGAAAGRGIEQLLAAIALVREQTRDAELRLALTETSPVSARYLAGLRQRVAREQWVTIADVPYTALPGFLAGCTVLAVPHPPGDYLDVATPVKLFDSMAAGRPLAVTPRVETARIVESCRAGLVAAGDSDSDLAAVIQRLLGDPALARELGANAARCARMDFDWGILSARLADVVLNA